MFDTSGATLNDIDISHELHQRPARQADHERVNFVLVQLAQEIALAPENILQKLAEQALDLCRAGSAGVSLLESDEPEPVFRWHALAGEYVVHRHGTMPRSGSPCGITIDRNSTQLMYLPERFFPAMRAAPRIFEALLYPFNVASDPVGTVWVVSHKEDRKFDAEDARIIKLLASFASAGYTLHQRNAELLKTKASLENEAQERKTIEARLRSTLHELEKSEAVLTERNADLESFERAVVGRELKMIELERENARLKAELEQSKPNPT
jgi:hypothetical protein